jgi:murein DD-endopeptidase MepM/ murein hydrolase activator NlpD
VFTKPLLTLSLAAALAAGCARPEPAPRPVSRGDIRLAAEFQTIEATVPPRATLDSLLRDNHLSDQLVGAAIDAARAVFDPRSLRADRPYRLVRSLDGLLREFQYQIDSDRFLRIFHPEDPDPAALAAEVVPYEKQTEVVAIDARIDSDHPSLVAAIGETGENVQLAISLAEIFSGEVDFQSDLQLGDSFRVLFEKTSHDGQFAGYGNILGAAIDVDGAHHEAFRWEDPSTRKAAYYDRDGRSLKRFFLRSPLKFDPNPRVTSRFSRSRLHPVDHQYKAHLGVDYHAITGAPVVAVAQGVVLQAGYLGANGNLVHIRHPGGYESYYLHLSSFGKGIRPGVHVDQGQLIGRVGSTGKATGPHLDFRLKKRGTFVNPIAEHSRQAPGEPIAASHLAVFREARDSVLSRLSTTLMASAAATPPVVKASGEASK